MNNKSNKKKGMRSDNRVQVTLTVGHRPDGTPIKKYFYGPTYTDACQLREDYKLQLRMGIVQNSRITVTEWVDKCLSLYKNNVDPHYRKGDAVPFHRMQKEIGNAAVCDVREADLQKLVNDIAFMSYSTVNKYYQAIRLVFEKARLNRIITINPAEGLQMPKCKKGTHRALAKWEVECIMQHWQEHRCGIWAMLMLLCGLRRGEMMALRWENIDMKCRILTVCEVAVIETNQSDIEERTKTAAGIRMLPICTPLWSCLNTVPKDKRKGLVCTMTGGKQISGSGFSRGWDGFNLAMQRILNNEDVVQSGRRVPLEKKIEIAQKQGKEYILFSCQAHDLRHTFATGLYDAGVDIKSAQYYLGHADIKMTLELYTHLSEEHENQQRSTLVSFLDSWLKL